VKTEVIKLNRTHKLTYPEKGSVSEKQKVYSGEFEKSTVKLAIESDQPIAQTARGQGINPNAVRRIRRQAIRYIGT